MNQNPLTLFNLLNYYKFNKSKEIKKGKIFKYYDKGKKIKKIKI
tara:strand:+ start:1445 stop:1576 length:132 start_codon:yes stop_codon:yes gene_type:complete